MSAAYDAVLAAQRRSSDPAVSAFVAANAGSGKTKVLTDRVARLLLAGADPAKILCITYTKAAAAEMADRLFRLLGDWALAGDADLRAALAALDGDNQRRFDAADLSNARRLFARALETPGGLKIQTIHSFCDALLRRFPLEAGAAPGFTVIEEQEAASLADAAIDDSVLVSETVPTLRAAFDRLMSRRQLDKARDLLRGQLLARHKLESALVHASWRDLAAACAHLIGLDPGETSECIIAGGLEQIDSDHLLRAKAAFDAAGGNAARYCGAPIGAYFAAASDAERWDALVSLFFDSKGGPRPKFGLAKAEPSIEQAVLDMQRTFVNAHMRAKAADNLADTTAILTILEAASARYAERKTLRAALDYDDLIAHGRRVFSDVDADWVRYKLDQGLDHILLDEAQDTSPAQWEVAEGPLSEFFAGAGARRVARTFFAVGDEKQSIYSFQGADAGLLSEKAQELARLIEPVAPFRNEPLELSFRSAKPILDFVDAVFAPPEAWSGVCADGPPKHALNRVGTAGRVELWPLVPKADVQEGRAWDAPLDAPAANDPRRRLARAVAAEVSALLAGAELPSRGRRARASDIMILVQSRGPLFDEMIRALTRAGAPVAGADKIRLLEEQAVLDLLSYARAALLPADDLALAETLKSPLFGFDEQALYDLAYPRPPGETLRRALASRAGERPEWRRAAGEIALASRIGRKSGAFEFLMHVLEGTAPSGRKRLYARLGEAAKDGIEELLRQALRYEAENPRSLQGFVLWAERNTVEVKREMEKDADAVRVMTVHGAKGLEAEIVFLLDAHARPQMNLLGPLFYARTAEAPRLPLFSRNSSEDGTAAARARADARRLAFEEYRRLLYVAATRARDRLYVCGVERRNDSKPHSKPIGEKSWHALAEDAFARLDVGPSARKTPWGADIRTIECAQTAPAEKDRDASTDADVALPDWLQMPAPEESAARRIMPSRIDVDSGDAPAYSPLRPPHLGVRGSALHRLLELLPDIPTAARLSAADRLLARLAPEVGEGERAEWREEALRVLNDARFFAVFGPESRAEVAITGRPANSEAFISGRIDRLAVEETRVLVVDYKTNRPPPQSVNDIPDSYLAQLAVYCALLQEIYPDHQVEAALLWTYDARLMPVPAAMLDRARARALPAA